MAERLLLCACVLFVPLPTIHGHQPWLLPKVAAVLSVLFFRHYCICCVVQRGAAVPVIRYGDQYDHLVRSLWCGRAADGVQFLLFDAYFPSDRVRSRRKGEPDAHSLLYHLDQLRNYYDLLSGVWYMACDKSNPDGICGVGLCVGVVQLFVCCLLPRCSIQKRYHVPPVPHDDPHIRQCVPNLQFLYVPTCTVVVFHCSSNLLYVCAGNMHDISWGTKEGNLQSETRRMHAGKADRAMQKAMLAQEAIQRLKAEVHDQKRQAAIAKRAAAIAAALPPKKASVQQLVTPLDLHGITGEPAEGAALALTQRQQSERQLSRGESASSLGGKSQKSVRSHKSQVGAEVQSPVIARLLEGEADKLYSSPMSPEEAAIVLAEAEATGAGEEKPTNGEFIVKGGADMVKVIDEDNRMEGFVDMTVLGQADAVLKMNLDEATAFNKAVLGKDALDTKKLIRDARKAAKAHREAAEREKRMADELALNKQAMQSEFNYFRIRMLMGWVIMNALFAVLMLGYDPKLRLYSAWVSSASVYTVGFKLLGSMIFQMMRGVKWLFRRLCGCCYRIEESETKNRNPVCCMRPSHYYALDDMWESEHNYDHA
jgi:hypothetical protein